jgi:aminoglycoside phosphotransferase (APT) family kinase protein
VLPELVGKDNPLWWSSSAVVGERFVAKFAWSRPAALRVAHEIGVLTALTREPGALFLPEVVASSTDPLLLVTRLVPGATLFDVVNSIDRDRAGRQLAWFLAALHQPATRERVEGAVGEISYTQLPPATTRVLRDRFGKWVRPDQRRAIMRWCGWADSALALPRPTVLVHGDLHGDNTLQAVKTYGLPGHSLSAAVPDAGHDVAADVHIRYFHGKTDGSVLVEGDRPGVQEPIVTVGAVAVS